MHVNAVTYSVVHPEVNKREGWGHMYSGSPFYSKGEREVQSNSKSLPVPVRRGCTSDLTFFRQTCKDDTGGGSLLP